MAKTTVIDTTHPVAIAVEPLRADAVKMAVEYAKAVIARVLADLAANDWDALKCAPYPSSLKLGRNAYLAAHAKYTLYRSLTERANEYASHRPGMPELLKQSDKSEARYLKSVADDAEAQYIGFVCKLCAKIGACDSATLDGNFVWSHSILTVRKGAAVERWKTQQIVNQSKLGTVFNQWPTRLVK